MIEIKSLEKHSVSRHPTFSRTWIFFLRRLSFFWYFFLLFSSLTLPISAFHLSILSEVRLLNFLRWVLLCIQYYTSLYTHITNACTGSSFDVINDVTRIGHPRQIMDILFKEFSGLGFIGRATAQTCCLMIGSGVVPPMIYLGWSHSINWALL